jgi:hypothetical protein
LALFEILANEDATVSAVASLVCDAPEERLDGMSFRSIAAVEDAFGMGDVSAAAAALLQGATIDRASVFLFAVLRENKKKTELFGRAIATVLERREDLLLEPKLGGQPRLHPQVLPAGPLPHHVQLLRDIKRWVNAHDSKVTITDEGVIEQGVAKLAELIHEDKLVSSFGGRLVSVADDAEEDTNKEGYCYYKSICTLEFRWEKVPQNEMEITRDNLLQQPPAVLQRAAVVLAGLGSDGSTDSHHTSGYKMLSMGLSAKDMKLLALYAMCGGTGEGFAVHVKLVQQKVGGWVKLIGTLRAQAPWGYPLMDEFCVNWIHEDNNKSTSRIRPALRTCLTLHAELPQCLHRVGRRIQRLQIGTRSS